MGDAVKITDDSLSAWAAALLARATDRRESRIILGIVGIPGGGKSTFAEKIVNAVSEKRPGAAVVVPMDGFHLTNATLDELGLRSRKGSPPTFDVAGYISLLHTAGSRGNTPDFPIYDRSLHEPVYTRRPEHTIGPEIEIVVTEGNYLLLDQSPWSDVAPCLSEAWYLDTSAEQAKQWVIARHVRGGRSEEDAAAHYERNDWPNTQLVMQSRERADRIVCW